jgi:hypothetical protein
MRDPATLIALRLITLFAQSLNPSTVVSLDRRIPGIFVSSKPVSIDRHRIVKR